MSEAHSFSTAAECQLVEGCNVDSVCSICIVLSWLRANIFGYITAKLFHQWQHFIKIVWSLEFPVGAHRPDPRCKQFKQWLMELTHKSYYFLTCNHFPPPLSAPCEWNQDRLLVSRSAYQSVTFSSLSLPIKTVQDFSLLALSLHYHCCMIVNQLQVVPFLIIGPSIPIFVRLKYLFIILLN